MPGVKPSATTRSCGMASTMSSLLWMTSRRMASGTSPTAGVGRVEGGTGVVAVLRERPHAEKDTRAHRTALDETTVGHMGPACCVGFPFYGASAGRAIANRFREAITGEMPPEDRHRW